MLNPALTFGEMTVFGELAQGVHPADELGLQMALALGRPDPPCPPFAIVPVLLDGAQIGQIEKIQFVWGAVAYQFRSATGNTYFHCTTKESVLQHLAELLQLPC